MSSVRIDAVDVIKSPQKKTVVSSVNRTIFDCCWRKHNSLTYRIKRRGPRIDPWGTPIEKSDLTDLEP